MDTAVEAPPKRKMVPDWLREGLFIVLSIGLAFGVEEFREQRSNHELASRVLTSLAAELEHNLAQIEPFVDVHRRWAEALAKADTSGGQSGLDIFIALRPRLPEGARANFPTQVRRGAWDAAVSTGSMRFIDYELVAAVSEVYGVQEFYGDTITRLSGAATGMPALDPATRALALRQMAVDMNEVVFAERLLLDLYRQHLPAIRVAVNE